MKQVDGLDEETGWGLSTIMGDGDATCHLDVNTGEVTMPVSGTLKLDDFIARYK